MKTLKTNEMENDDENTQAGSDCQKRLVSGSFTPGPWKADGYHVRQSGQRGTRMIADVCYTGPHHTPPDEYPKSCRLADEANARLIAAAPDLLDALRAMMKIIGPPEDPAWADDDQLDAAWELSVKAVSMAISSANA